LRASRWGSRQGVDGRACTERNGSAVHAPGTPYREGNGEGAAACSCKQMHTHTQPNRKNGLPVGYKGCSFHRVIK
jgi:hypothetical protein